MTKAAFKSDQVVIAMEDCIALVDGTEIHVRRGDRLRGSDPVVAHLGPAYFKSDGDPKRHAPAEEPA